MLRKLKKKNSINAATKILWDPNNSLLSIVSKNRHRYSAKRGYRGKGGGHSCTSGGRNLSCCAVQQPPQQPVFFKKPYPISHIHNVPIHNVGSLHTITDISRPFRTAHGLVVRANSEESYAYRFIVRYFEYTIPILGIVFERKWKVKKNHKIILNHFM